MTKARKEMDRTSLANAFGMIYAQVRARVDGTTDWTRGERKEKPPWGGGRKGVRPVLTILFAILAVICAYKWLFWRVTTAVMLWYIQETGNPLPSKEKTREGYQWVGEQMFIDLTGQRKKH